MKKRFNDFYNAYHFLYNHKMVEFKNKNYFSTCLDIDVVKVNPKTKAIDNNENLNTETNIWLEFGKISEEEILPQKLIIVPNHDIDLDCGANTFEEAIIILANLVDKFYNDDGSKK